MTLDELAINHPYYCNTSNYYSNDAYMSFDTMTEFLNEYEDSDEDLNFVFRWDVYRRENETYRAEIFIMHQRKGRFVPCDIRSIDDCEVDRFVAYLGKHWTLINKLWQPLTNQGETL